MANHSPYHHGDLRSALLQEANVMLRESGIDGLSLRQLAERVGVSRMAPYHHFKDKHELLCALAAEGFRELDKLIEQAAPASSLETQELHTTLARFVRDYVHFAVDNPDRYELMFGRPIWKGANPSAELKETAFACFRHYAERIGTLIGEQRLPKGSKPLRLAQASWATLHGLCRLMIDGIYVNQTDMEEVSHEAVRLMLAVLTPNRG
ncbi:TetR/AcrR family transcriptional regulator [Alcanivorax sp. 1008]|uniref:TetR/AcrR family transcriptional regulator n=1 Tax=Alcanivorax sp. 1008 TaxID=2816853 RepID=UPI001DEC9654|nr:TetR/AcrR family transcriptional regulator [Alcanivorax sp. 1008]MCC1495405.1 TetR/AcrR family transcriptional regulator [Alcanivorax sp. 1008]